MSFSVSRPRSLNCGTRTRTCRDQVTRLINRGWGRKLQRAVVKSSSPQRWGSDIPISNLKNINLCSSLSLSTLNRRQERDSRWRYIKMSPWKVQLLPLPLVPMKPSVMVITAHLVLSWLAEWLKSGALQLAAGFYMLPLSSIRPHLSHEGHWGGTAL